MKFKLKKGSPNMFPLKQKIEEYMAEKTQNLYYNKRLRHYVGDSQKTVIVELKVTFED